MKILKKIIIVLIFPIILAYPTWHYYLKDKFQLPGPIYSTPDNKLNKVLNDSNILKEVRNYKIFILQSALSMKIIKNRYFGPEGYSFNREKLYIGLLNNIIEVNNEKLEMMVLDKDKCIIIYPKNLMEKVN